MVKKYRGCHVTKNIEDGYLGSGTYFKKAVNKYGKENFSKKILLICDTLEEMIEKEAEYVNEEWVNNPNTYNLQTGGLNYGVLCDDSKRKISISIKELYSKGVYDTSTGFRGKNHNEESRNKISKTLKKRYENQEHHLKGKEPWNKNKTGVQEGWNKGMKMPPMSEKEKKKRSETLKKKYENQEHHLKGRVAHNKGKKTGKPSWNSGKIMDKNIICPHCNTAGASLGNMKRWHFDNCKHKRL